MRDVGYLRAPDVGTALDALTAVPGAHAIAGGTDMLNLIKDGIETPHALVDINRIGHAHLHHDADGLHIGALARMAAVLADPAVRGNYPALAQALELSASPQLRNAATIGGNVLQRTRCPYFRAERALPCNKREPGSGCAAVHGHDRTLAVFGWSDSCRATHPSDLAVALAALDARLTLVSPHGRRTVRLTDFHLLPGDTPARETVLDPGELLLSIDVPAPAPGARSGYLKVRERASYEFALVSVAAALELDTTGDRPAIRRLGLALGGVAAKPWRLHRAEEALVGEELTAAAIRPALDSALRDARPLKHNTFKVELAKRAVIRTLERIGGPA
ncbi:FAD binding domain-containing protein [Streptomyces sp. BRA346]|uniref:FAD binding domain-containing protein n=1 Tax=Streptomyces sp. BRA346 TaxID=2878199 RepID=UPI00406283B1